MADRLVLPDRAPSRMSREAGLRMDPLIHTGYELISSYQLNVPVIILFP
jgi:hypothetical protein